MKNAGFINLPERDVHCGIMSGCDPEEAGQEIPTLRNVCGDVEQNDG